MRQRNPVASLEIGTSKICVAVGEAKPGDTTRIYGVAEAPSAGIHEGEIVDLEAAASRVRETIAAAEEKSQLQVRSVYVAVTGWDIHSFNTRGVVTVPDGREKIDERDVELVRTNAREVSLPWQNAFVHSIPHHYRVDGVEGVRNPIGMPGRRLEADFHIVHGVTRRIQETIRCVKELGLELEDIVFAPLASSLVLLNDEQKDVGALVIDIGGGTTDYILYVDGAVEQSGMLPFGGDDITEAISLRLHVPTKEAEALKIESKKTTNREALKSGDWRDAFRLDAVHTIIHSQLNNLFEATKKQLEHGRFIAQPPKRIFLTGGSSLVKGIDQLAEAVFGVPARMAHPKNVLGLSSAFEAPQFSTAIGLIEYAKGPQLHANG